VWNGFAGPSIRAKKNALTIGLYQGLADAMKRVDEDAAVRVALIHGQADVFTSGNDISDFIERPPTGMRDPVFQFLQRICNTAKPVVAAVNGPAVGIGTTMLLHCDYVVAGEGAYFAVPFVNLALCPEAGSSLLFPAHLGYKRAAEMLLFGERVDSHTAHAWGLVNLVVDDSQAADIGMAKARILAAKPAQALWTTKALMKRRLATQAAQQMGDEGKEFQRLLHSPTAREILTAFAEQAVRRRGGGRIAGIEAAILGRLEDQARLPVEQLVRAGKLHGGGAGGEGQSCRRFEPIIARAEIEDQRREQGDRVEAVKGDRAGVVLGFRVRRALHDRGLNRRGPTRRTCSTRRK